MLAAFLTKNTESIQSRTETRPIKTGSDAEMSRRPPKSGLVFNTTTQDQTVSSYHRNHHSTFAVKSQKRPSIGELFEKTAKVSEADAFYSNNSQTPSAHLVTKYNQPSITMQNTFKCVFQVLFQHLRVDLLFCFVPFNPPLNCSIFLATTKKKMWRPLWPIKTKTKSFCRFFKALSALDSGI